MTMAPGTTAFYDDWASSGQENARSLMSRQFEAAFAPGARLLDIGCGKGRDLAVLREMGFDAYGLEPHDAMRAQALAQHPHLAGRIAPAALPDIGQPFGGGFDGVLCSAVLMHIPDANLAASLAACSAVLRPQARVLMAVPEMQANLLVDGHDRDGRQFTNHSAEHIARLLAGHAFSLLRADDLVTADDTHWRVLLFQR
jgi:2-polyprenyl-3-methyl-5-hydroxy-6-metoxy-1,4-benzoquinol methylase